MWTAAAKSLAKAYMTIPQLTTVVAEPGANPSLGRGNAARWLWRNRSDLCRAALGPLASMHFSRARARENPVGPYLPR
jgi:hypothetical protein